VPPGTKLVNFDETLMRQTVGGTNQNRIYVDANGTARGLLLTWKNSTFALQSQEAHQNTITVELAFKLDNSRVQITGVYEPSTRANR
jgi:hypothetical protein